MKRMVVLALVAGGALSGCASPGATEVRLAQEQHSCAEVGFVPGSAGFSNCTLDLDATMMKAYGPKD